MPVTLFSERRLAELLTRSRMPEFADACARLRAEVAALEDMGLKVPGRSAGYFHDYFCPEHAVAFAWDPRIPKAHRCPVDGKVFTGEPFDSAWLWPVNTHLSRGAFKSALLWRIDGDEAHRKRAEAILTGYARRYASYETRRKGMRLQGRCCYHSLDESVWLIPLTQAYDLIREGLSVARRRQVEGDLLIPAAEHIVTQLFHDIHNIECWHLAAIGTVGGCLDRPDLIRLAVDSPHGFWKQLEAGVRPDGFWYEGSTSYHFYTMAAMIALAAAMEGAGMELHRAERLRRMFQAPVEYAYPDLRMPAMNDCWYFTTLLGETCHNTPDAAGFYEVGCAWYGEEFAWILEENYRRIKRDSLEALLYGRQTAEKTTDDRRPTTDDRRRQTADSPPSSPTAVEKSFTPSLPPQVGEGGGSIGWPPVTGGERGLSRLTSHVSRLFPNSGYAVLRAERPSVYLLLKYGPHGGGHGHPDKLSLILHACGEPVSPDLGTPGYGIALNSTWYRRTISHNTVVIDGVSQPPNEGHLNRFEGEGGKGFLAADAGVSWDEGGYKGVSMRRIILMECGVRSAECGVKKLKDSNPQSRVGRRSCESSGVVIRNPQFRYFIDLFAVTCDRPRQIDWVFRCKRKAKGERDLTHPHSPSLSHWERGQWVATSWERQVGRGATTASLPGRGRVRSFALSLSPCPSPLEGEGYEHISHIRAGKVEDGARLSWRTGRGGVDLFLVGASEVFVGDAPFNPASERTDIVIVRRRARATVFASVLCVHEGRPCVRGVRDITGDLHMKDVIGLVVETKEGEEPWVISL